HFCRDTAHDVTSTSCHPSPPFVPRGAYLPHDFFFTHTPTPAIYTLSLHDALPISPHGDAVAVRVGRGRAVQRRVERQPHAVRRRSEEHTSELQSRGHLVCRLLLEKKKKREKYNKRHRTPPVRNVVVTGTGSLRGNN